MQHRQDPNSWENNFIFASYSHKDKERVHAIVQRMRQDGYRIWYDEDIRYGDAWNKTAAQRVESCACLFAFISPHYIVSDNALDELEFARAIRKRIILIYLESTALPSELKMHLSRRLAITERDYRTDEELPALLYRRGGLESFRELPLPPGVKEISGNRIVFANGDVYEGDIVGGIRNGKGKCTYANGNVYIGDWVDGKRNGQGTLTYTGGAVYEGSFADDRINGQGKITFSTGDVYEGDLVDGKINGRGKCTYANGDVYEGGWVNGKKSGKGKYTFASGGVYEGDWVDGKRNGQCVMHYVNGDVYEGQWRGSFEDGEGTLTHADGRTERGLWEKGKLIRPEAPAETPTEAPAPEATQESGEDASPLPEGVLSVGGNRIVYQGGHFYEGEHRDGVPNGQGRMNYLAGEYIEGLWEDGRCVHGKRQFWDGRLYEGDFAGKKNAANGQGIMQFPNGDLYEGAFAKNKPHGQGVMHYANGAVYSGLWRHGLREDSIPATSSSEIGHAIASLSEGLIRYKNGEVYEGEHRDGVPNGQGKLQYTNGSYIEGLWEDGRCVHGKRQFEDGKLYEGEFAGENNKAQGQGVMQFPNGEIYEGAFAKNKPHGLGVMRYPNGDRVSGRWKNGEKQEGERVLSEEVPKREGPPPGMRESIVSVKGNTVLYADGKQYEGEHRDGIPQGYGRMTQKKTRTHKKERYVEGTWENGRCRQGKKLYADQSVYVGSFDEDTCNPTGKGVMRYSNGNVFIGFWKAGQWLKGEMRFADGRVYNGDWHKQRFNGAGTLTLPDGSVRTGLWENGVLRQEIAPAKKEKS